MRDNVKSITGLFVECFDPPGPVVEIGSLQVEGQEGFADVRPLFLKKQFIGCDMREGPGVDRIENGEALSFKNGEAGTVIMLDTLEHVARPYAVLEEIKRVLAENGLLLMISTMDFPIHNYPGDYWRFTPGSFELLLEGLSPSAIFYQGNPYFPHTLVGLAKKGGGAWPLKRFAKKGREMDNEDQLLQAPYEYSNEPMEGYPVPELYLYSRMKKYQDLMESKDREISNLKEELEMLKTEKGNFGFFRRRKNGNRSSK